MTYMFIFILSWMMRINVGYEWYNWNGATHCTASYLYAPLTKDDLIDFVTSKYTSKASWKVAGYRHSFSDVTTCINANSTARTVYVVSLVNLTTMSINPTDKTVTFGAGWGIDEIAKHLQAHSLTIKNLGTSRVQNYIGAYNTGTHGTGRKIGNIASQVIGLKLLLSNGTVLNCSNSENANIFKAAKISIGSLGIIIETTMQAVDLYKIKRTEKLVDSTDFILNISKYIETYDRFMGWGPFVIDHKTPNNYTFDNAILQNKTRISIFEETTENITDGGCYDIANCCDDECNNITSSGGIDGYVCIDYAYLALSQSYPLCHTTFAAIFEHFVPLKYYAELFIDYTILQLEQGWFEDSEVNTIMQVRFIQSDDIPLSTVYETVKGETHESYGVLEVEWDIPYNNLDLLSKYEAFAKQFRERFDDKFPIRPHWGKQSWFNYSYAVTVYPEIDSFISLRNELDPQCQFVNEYIMRVFNLSEACGMILDLNENIPFETTQEPYTTTQDDTDGSISFNPLLFYIQYIIIAFVIIL